MKERPILFNTEMVKAILEGRKTQTRRVVKSDKAHLRQKVCREGSCFPHEFLENWMFYDSYDLDEIGRESNCISDRNVIKCPFGNEGDRLWVRETWHVEPGVTGWSMDENEPCTGWIEYKAGGSKEVTAPNFESVQNCFPKGEVDWDFLPYDWRPSIFMPRWASRILIEITNIRVERLNDISVEDAKAEGFDYSTHPSAIEMGYAIGAKTNFRFTWEQIYGQNAWNKNPWVWVVEFRVIEESAK